MGSSAESRRRVILVTGTSRGIGREIKNHYLSLGDRVVGCSRAPVEATEHYDHYELDVADEAAVVEMVRSVAEDLGRIDALINNAGIARMNHVLLTPLADLREVFSVNVFGTFVLAREVAKVMVRRKFGRIVNFSTVATPLKLEGEAAYAASKAAVTSLTQVLARELAPFNITVNSVGPTPIDTDLIRGVPKEKIDRLLEAQAIPRLGLFRDVTNVTDFFLREESDFITGQVIYLGGVS